MDHHHRVAAEGRHVQRHLAAFRGGNDRVFDGLLIFLNLLISWIGSGGGNNTAGDDAVLVASAY